MADHAGTGEPTQAEQAALAVFVAAGLCAVALSRGWTAWPLLLAAPLASLRYRIRRVPAGLTTPVIYVATSVLLATVVVGFIVGLYPVVSERTTALLIHTCGAVLAVLATLFLLATPVWSPARAAVPATLGLLTTVAVGAQETAPSGGVAALLIVAFVAAAAWLALSGRPGGVAARGMWGRVAVSAVGALALAFGLVRLLPWAQPKVEKAAVGVFSESVSRSYSGLSTQSRLGDIEELALSPRVVLRVWSSQPQNLRARVLTRFDGRMWSAPRMAERLLAPAPNPADPDLQTWLQAIPGATLGIASTNDHPGSLIRSRLVSVEPGLPLLSPPRPRLVRAPGAVRVNSFDVLSARGHEIYGVANVGTPAVERLPESGSVLAVEDDAALTEALNLPTTLDPRLRALAAELSPADATPHVRVLRTIGHFQANFRYSLKVGAFRSKDPVAEFVFEKKKGYCEYFASAATLLLRLQGVPTRYVTGFSVRSANFIAGHYVVREADAHAWIESYLPGHGWVEADPTPPGDYEEVHAGLRGGPLSAALEWLKARWAEMVARFRSAGWADALGWLTRELGRLLDAKTWLAVAAGLALLGFAGRALWRRARRATRPERTKAGEIIPAELQELIRLLDRAWARRGCPRPPSRAPLEHVQGLPVEKAPPALRAIGTDVVLAVYGALFAGRPLPSGEGARLRGLVEQIERGSAVGTG